MSANSALIFDFSAAQRPARRASDRAPVLPIGESLKRLERCLSWLECGLVEARHFVFSTLHDPVIIVEATPRVWMLFSGRVHDKGYKQAGSLRYRVYEGIDQRNQVAVRWEEVSACA